VKILYIESIGGASGDMLLGALVDCGLNWEEFAGPLEKALPELKMHRESVVSRGLASTRVWGEAECEPPCRHLSDIVSLIEASKLSPAVKEDTYKAFKRLALAEADAHGTTIEEVHFHEVGATDSIMDVAGFFLALELLGVEKVVASPLKLGSGTVKTSHGLLPVPVPAVARLVTGVPLESVASTGELTTPTGALLITQVADSYGPLPSMVVGKTGVGCGSRESTDSHWNVVRVWLGEEVTSSGVEITSSGIEKTVSGIERMPSAVEERVMIEFNIDDMDSESLSYLQRKLEAAGARDVSIYGGVGKKGRVVHLLQILVLKADFDNVRQVIFKHSATIGFRYHPVKTCCLQRTVVTVEIEGLSVRVKESFLEGALVQRKPEFEDCVSVAEKTGMTLDDIRRIALTEADKSGDSSAGLSDS
jgi:hypothetical protein